jgi:hypothetical protein
VVFDPDVYPLNWACWKGRVSKHWHEEEHPLDAQAFETTGSNGEWRKGPSIRPDTVGRK